MPIRVKVNREIFARLLSGEQNWIYLRRSHQWKRKLAHPRSGVFYRNQTLYITTFSARPEKVIAARVDHTEEGWGRGDWGASRDELYYCVKLKAVTVLLPPFHAYVLGESVRNRIK